uniref:Uncharacterized protein n=1 Tax=Rhizophora mucronata TaxID=61149 RepID=A0A2P2NX33_RHIMU
MRDCIFLIVCLQM